ncbi:efflux RND transporter periplasmic adaptor subunit [Marinobacter bryozoorum]|uniref:efflux RND transporter periplasmic adaptor subunit n=1 Tax=Marinobacter bryozoorum TaxID=256324 RepID=UPI0020041D31|nr:efflux RND transporter periplasmic adaptor subunit [Marinobacter bryozoorum]MCK7545106.1 efflux RND transporter periplasmic adaptor subunit [Marinobacter bryozoorum]
MSKISWSSAGLSVLVLVALVVWLLTGDIRSAEDDVPEEARQDSSTELPAVEVERRTASTFEPSVRLQGQVEAWRRVEVTARLAAEVQELSVELGDSVKQGERLLVLSEDDRPAAVAGARARVRQLEAELAATDRLRSDRLASESDKLRLEAELAAARAELRQASLAMTYLEPKAPFDGTVNARLVEAGTLVQAGEPLFELVQVDPLKVSGFVPQQQAGQLVTGQPVTVSLLDGRKLEGELTFVASAADHETRSFRIEARVRNPEQLRIAGGSASLEIHQPPTEALFLSPALLSLGPDGRPGILHVTDDNRVAFSEVNLLSVGTEGAWVSGIELPVNLITRGGGFVAQGQQVRPVPVERED